MLYTTHHLVENAVAPDALSKGASGASSSPLALSDRHGTTPRQRKLVLSLCIGMVIITGALLPFAQMPWGRVPFFFPAYQSAAIVSCLITAYLMYGHFKATRAVSLLHLSAGYLYTAGVLFMQFLPQQGAFVQDARLVGGAQSAIWLWFFWHLGPALSVLYLAWSHHRTPGQLAAPGNKAVRRTLLILLMATAATALLVFSASEWLPVLDVADDFSRITTSGIAPGLQLLFAVALILLWRVSGFRDVLHLWMGIVVVALLCDNAVTMMAGGRLTLGWYAGRMGALLGLSVMTVVYLQELKNANLASLASAEELMRANSRLDSEIHERRVFASKLEKADLRKDQFLAMLAHELRNPLAPISTAAELLGLGQLSRAEIQETSYIIARQVKHMTGLVDDLLDVSRVNNGFVKLDWVLVDIKQVITDAIEQVKPFVDAHQHRLTVQLAPEPTHVTGDHKRLVQVVANLLSNAVKFTPENGHISVRLDATKAHIVIGVADNGIGISAQLLPDVFNVFTQGETTVHTAQNGLGLGLAIVKSMVELHSGSTSAQSLGDGKGSEFTVCLPRLFMHREDLLQSRQPAPAQPVIHSGAAILVVDDNVDAAVTLGAFLRAKGFRVAVEHNAQRALHRAEMETFDAFFLDIGMHGMDGLMLMRRLRALSPASAQLMVAVTGYGSKGDTTNFLAAGFDECLVKPASLRSILKVLTRIQQGSNNNIAT